MYLKKSGGSKEAGYSKGQYSALFPQTGFRKQNTKQEVPSHWR